MVSGMLTHFLEGFNTCLFCYGQTGTGNSSGSLGQSGYQREPCVREAATQQFAMNKSEVDQWRSQLGWADAGVGIGMLWGGRDSLLERKIFQYLSSFN